MIMTYTRGGLRHIYYSQPIENMHLTPRALNAFKRAGINTIGTLFGKTVEEILDLPGVGAGTLGDILETSATSSSVEERLTALESRVDEEMSETATRDDIEAIRREIQEEVTRLDQEISRLDKELDDNAPPF